MSLRIQIKVTVPKEILNTREVRNAIVRAQQRETAPGLKRLFGQTVDGWNNPPDWMQHQQISSDRISMQVYAGGRNADQYALVNAGSPEHNIPLHPGFLRFQKGYHASTSPRILSSRSFSRFGPYWVAKQVHHHGFKGRAFDETIAEEYGPTFQEEMQSAIGSVTHS